MKKLAYTKRYYLKHPKEFVLTVRQAYWKWPRQRRKRGYSDADLWNLDGFILESLLRWIKAFRALPPHGYPSRYVDDNDSEMGYNLWLSILDEIIVGLEHGLLCEDIFLHDDFDENRVKFEKGMDLLKEHLMDMWD